MIVKETTLRQRPNDRILQHIFMQIGVVLRTFECLQRDLDDLIKLLPTTSSIS